MEPTFNLEARTSYGEDLYVYPYSYKYSSNKLFFYPATQSVVKDTQQYLRDNQILPKYSRLFKYVSCFKEWLELFGWQFEDFFGSAVFDECFKYREWSLDLYWLTDNLKYSHVFTAESVFGKDISLRGQLYICSSKYFEDCYLTPTKEYFDERLDEWINDDVASLFANDTYTTEEDKQELIQFYSQLRQDYKNWRDTEIAKGNRIEYLYSLNT